MSSARLLVLHGPLLDGLGVGPLAGVPRLDAVNRGLELALAGTATLRFSQAGSEPELVLALHRARDWASHVLVSPGPLAPCAYVLREALALMKLPFAEVFLDAFPNAAEHAAHSVLRASAAHQHRGVAPAVYIEAAEKLLGAAPKRATAGPTPSRVEPRIEKQIGRVAGRNIATAAPGSPIAKTIGRKPAQQSAPANTGINRAAVRQRIIDRLGGRISPSQLATWGREQWLAVDGGAATESGQRELLAETLQALALSAAVGSSLSEPELLDLLARMG